MDFNNLSIEDKKLYTNLLFQLLESPDDVKNWAKLFLNLELPHEITDIETTSNPLDAIWQIYNTFKTNSGDKNPGYILMSARECLKTVSVSVMEILLMLHMQLEIGHAAAVEDQSAVALGYINGFIMNLAPLLNERGWVPISENKRLIKYSTPEGKRPFIKVVICNPRGMNSLHANLLVLDELDLADPLALKEGKYIVSYSRGIHGVKVYLSTRKYAFGNMAQAIDKAPEMNFKILRWNILDVTEKCSPLRHEPNGPKVDRYVAKNLPLLQISPEEYDVIPHSEQTKYDLVKDVFNGCISCNLLPVCRMKLAYKSAEAIGGFYKPISTVSQLFRENDPDSAEAQLLCWRPGSAGLVYPRFNSTLGKGNVISLRDAYEFLIGEKSPRQFIGELDLLAKLKELQIPLYTGVDWGFTHDSVIVTVAKLPDGQIWVIDCWAVPGLEFSDILLAAISFRDKYDVQKWFCDQAAPANIKSFNKNAMKSPKFTKDVMGGIESLRFKISNAAGAKMFKVIDTPNTKKVITAISKHKFKLDGQGNPTTEPDDQRGIADICDSLRYIGQNLFPIRGSQKPEVAWTDIKSGNERNENGETVDQQMLGEIRNRLVDTGEIKISTGRKGGFHFNF